MTTGVRTAFTPTRRTVASGLMWTVPVVVASTPAPAFAVSGCQALIGVVSPTYIATAPSSTSAVRTSVNWTVPAGVTSICFSIAGGGGGGSAATRIGGSGALLTGSIPVTPGEVLTLIVGAGGNRSVGTAGSAGGGGYGAGGSTANGNGFTGGSGGGGSAILRGSTPLVVAGGGGGAGGYSGFQTTNYAWTYTGGAGGNAEGNGAAAGLTLTNASNFSASLPGGNGASGATAGAATAQPTFTGGGTVVTSTTRTAGGAGAAPPTGSGADGILVTATNGYSFASGAGGGGYAGGGSGSPWPSTPTKLALTASWWVPRQVLAAAAGLASMRPRPRSSPPVWRTMAATPLGYVVRAQSRSITSRPHDPGSATSDPPGRGRVMQRGGRPRACL